MQALDILRTNNRGKTVFMCTHRFIIIQKLHFEKAQHPYTNQDKPTNWRYTETETSWKNLNKQSFFVGANSSAPAGDN